MTTAAASLDRPTTDGFYSRRPQVAAGETGVRRHTTGRGLRSVAAWLTALACVPAATLAAPPVERIDPPSWWIGFETPELQLLVHGPQVALLVPSITYPGVRLLSTTRAESPNYLFLTLRIDRNAEPGNVPIEFSRGDRRVARHNYPLAARRPGSRDRRGFDSSDVIYLVMPDRFANGEPGNDHPPGSLDRVDRTATGARHGGDLAGIRAHLDYLEGMGFTQLWLTPVLENAQPTYSYHGYSITDHYRIDPRFGSNEEYAALSHAARARGIGLIADMVVNHIGSRHWWMNDPPSSDWLSGGGTKAPTNHMHTSIQDPHAAAVDRELYTGGWFAPTMPDLNDRNALLATYLIENALWWVEYADLSGIRIDTYSYSDKAFMAAFTGRIMAEYPHFNIVGEEWHEDPAIVSYWQSGRVNADGYVSHLPSLMDFPLRHALLSGLTEPDGWSGGLRALYERLSDDFLYPRPQNLVVFADNHDTDRIYTALANDYDLFRMALTYVATMRGIPQIFYGTEILMANGHPHDDGEVRRDFPGGWPGDAVDAFTARGLAAPAAAAQTFVRTLLNWRKHSPAVHDGSLRHYAPLDGTYVYFRQLGPETVMVALNKHTTAAKLDLGRFRESLARGATGRNVLTGAPVELLDELTLPPRSATVLDLQ
jgi:glycosidase